jgi:glycosyltransferase involved in cell wall biosynthesis
MGIENLHCIAPVQQLLKGESITVLMYTIWCSRKDLQRAFDLATPEGQEGFVAWYKVSVLREYGIDPESPARFERLRREEEVLKAISRFMPASVKKVGSRIWLRYLAREAKIISRRKSGATLETAYGQLTACERKKFSPPGFNLIGYAHAELGMGEHVRMTAAALASTNIPYGVYNFDVGVSSRKSADLDHGELIDENRYNINAFHINADQMLTAYCHLGHDFFARRYNIGYWAWELAKCPNEWLPVVEMVDEIWAPSKFIQSAFAEVTSVPVYHMPLCVALPSFRKRDRKYFGLPENDFLFTLAFDFLSFINRKNPFAVIKAFKSAFADKRTRAGLVIKVMNGDPTSSGWSEMLSLINGDHRIHVVNQTMSRSDVLALIDTTDCFVSLHRSEGFGRGPAEAMLMGKPVIVTNYSGNTDFTKRENSCLVNYQLIPVTDGDYVFAAGQVWADPDVEHAAWWMRRLVDDSGFAREIASRGRETIATEYNQTIIGEWYSRRFRDLL